MRHVLYAVHVPAVVRAVFSDRSVCVARTKRVGTRGRRRASPTGFLLWPALRSSFGACSGVRHCRRCHGLCRCRRCLHRVLSAKCNKIVWRSYLFRFVLHPGRHSAPRASCEDRAAVSVLSPASQRRSQLSACSHPASAESCRYSSRGEKQITFLLLSARLYVAVAYDPGGGVLRWAGPPRADGVSGSGQHENGIPFA